MIRQGLPLTGSKFMLSRPRLARKEPQKHVSKTYSSISTEWKVVGKVCSNKRPVAESSLVLDPHINSKPQHPPPPPWHRPGFKIPAVSRQNSVRMPFSIAGFVCQMPAPLLKNNRRRLLSSLIKLGSKQANTSLVTIYI